MAVTVDPAPLPLTPPLRYATGAGGGVGLLLGNTTAGQLLLAPGLAPTNPVTVTPLGLMRTAAGTSALATNAPVTLAAGQRLVMAVTADYDCTVSGGQVQVTFTDSGLGLSWARLDWSLWPAGTAGGFTSLAEIWISSAAAGGSGTVTATASFSAGVLSSGGWLTAKPYVVGGLTTYTASNVGADSPQSSTSSYACSLASAPAPTDLVFAVVYDNNEGSARTIGYPAGMTGETFYDGWGAQRASAFQLAGSPAQTNTFTGFTSGAGVRISGASVAIVPPSSSVTLAPANLTAQPTIDAVVLTQTHVLAVADLTAQPTVDALTLTQTHVLAGVGDLTAQPTIDAVVLTQTHVLAVADLTAQPTVDAVTLQLAGTLAVADLTAQPTIGTVTLTQTHVLAVASATSAPTIGAVVLALIGATLTGRLTTARADTARTTDRADTARTTDRSGH